MSLKTVLKSCLLTTSRYKGNVRFSSTFKAAQLMKIGEPLVFESIKRPKLQKNEVRVQVAACSVNTWDVQNFNDVSKKLPFTPGYEFSGEILEVGKKVPPDHIGVGDKVAALNLLNFGGLAQECVVDMNDVWRLPSNIEMTEAAVILFGHATALFTFGKLMNMGCVEDNYIVVSVGSAGLGLAAVDVISNIFKKKVIAVTETEVRSELTRELGAHSTIHYDEAFARTINSYKSEAAISAVYDAVGENMTENLVKCVSLHGHVFLASQFLGTLVNAPPAHSPLTIVNLKELREQSVEKYRTIISDTLEMAKDEVIQAHISKKFKFEDVNKAIEYINSKQCTGKVLVEIDS